MTDKEQLDWLDDQLRKSGYKWWIWSDEHESLTMASETYHCEPGEIQKRTIREVIDAAAKKEEKAHA